MKQDFEVSRVLLALKDVNGSKAWQGACKVLSDMVGSDWKLSLDLPDLPAPAPLPAPPAVHDAVQVLGQLAAAINNAAGLLDQQQMMVASGSVTVDLNVGVPGTDAGATSHVALQFGPKPFA